MTYTPRGTRVPQAEAGNSSDGSGAEGTPIFLALGSNLGDRIGHLRMALASLADGGVVPRAVSSVYESESAGYASAPPFLNAVLSAVTRLEPEEVLALCQAIERRAGRRPAPRNAPRELDLDILFHGSLCIRVRELVIPHPAWSTRSFVLEPLVEIAPDWTDPESGRTVRDIHGDGAWNRSAVTRVLPPEALLVASDPEVPIS
jgi:2-amino-4-hydroxy-6-hydroxymethyldihydropteridine diphosphokinase